MKPSVDQTTAFQRRLGDTGCFHIEVMPSQRERSMATMAGDGELGFSLLVRRVTFACSPLDRTGHMGPLVAGELGHLGAHISMW